MILAKRALTRGIPVAMGGGVPIRRYLGTPEIEQIDPFILLDWFESEVGSAGNGFSPHPHRGFDVVTLMVEGQMRHRDNYGHSGVADAGGMQWMRTGSGLIHAEAPVADTGVIFGLQLWINLPAAEKRSSPHYLAVGANQVPQEQMSGVTRRVFAGTTHKGENGPLIGLSTAPLIDELVFDQGAGFASVVPTTHQGFVLVTEGVVAFESSTDRITCPKGQLVALQPGESLMLSAESSAHVVIALGKPIAEPVVRSGPFVMSSRTEILQAYRDYQAGRFGPVLSTSGEVS